jgi:3',5'-cyclic AMP phosphodiesterase CpdA
MSDSITILHLSDLQFGRNHRFGRLADDEGGEVSFDTLFRRLTDDLKLLPEANFHPQLIVVSGDLVETGANAEFADSLEFLTKLCAHLELSHNRVILVPGNHDINRKLCEGYFLTCEGEGENPQKPYWPKWKPYERFFTQFYGDQIDIKFSQSEPWTTYIYPELKIIVAGLNSTIEESHLDNSHYGIVGERQLTSFSEKFSSYISDGWFRFGVVHHNLERGAIDDNENLRDKDDFKKILGSSLNLILHGHTHEGKAGWLGRNLPIFSTGSTALKKEQRPEEVGNQYQVLRIKRNSVERWMRRYDPLGKRWIGDTRASKEGDAWIVKDDVEFADVSTALTEDEATLARSGVVQQPTAIVQIDRPLTAAEAEHRLDNLPRLKLKAEDHHRAIRRAEQEKMLEYLEKGQVVWLVADWGQGKIGFLACALERYGGPGALANAFRLQCGGIENCDDLFAGAETQLGLSFEEFLAAVAALPGAVLILDDLSDPILRGKERESLEKRLKPILDFCPKLKIVLIGRQSPREIDAECIVVLKPLESVEICDYLRYHSRANQGLDVPEHIEDIEKWSGGLPMHLDRLLDRLPYVTLSEILNEEQYSTDANAGEPIPEGLKAAFSQLSAAEDKISKRSYKLLKVLTVLRDGETFYSIRRFYREPFYQTDIDLLVSYALLESIQISQTAPELTIGRQLSLSAAEAPRLLLVPRQVRDYVNAKMSDEERDEITRASMDLFFGQNWWKGKIRLRTTIANAYGQSAIAGPGNEHVVARMILVKALEKGTKQQCKRYAQLALSYCLKLNATDRFRDAVISSKAILELLGATDLKKEYYEAAFIHGKSQRMIGNLDIALEKLELALAEGKSYITEEFKEEILLSLALCLQSKSRKTDALEKISELIKIAHPDSGNAIQAQAILAELTLTGAQLVTRLTELEKSARNRDSRVVANNIALGLADSGGDPEASILWLNKVILSERDNYNRSRAIIEKASILSRHINLSELTEAEHKMLGAAYSYSYAQRMGNLLDRCHQVLWKMCRKSDYFGILLRLFRFSSFIWRLRGENSQERKYLDQLSDVDIKRLDSKEANAFRIEIIYLERRRADAVIEV